LNHEHTAGALIERLQAGDRDAVDELYRRYRDRVYAVCCRVLCGDVAAAQDATQDTFLAVLDGALTRGPGDGPPGSPEAYLLRIARNKAVDVVRRRGRLDAQGNRRSREQPVADVPETADPCDAADPEATVTRLAGVDFSRALVNRALAGLKESAAASWRCTWRRSSRTCRRGRSPNCWGSSRLASTSWSSGSASGCATR
jgi:RNA polymerase sigma factor (sigma-70 family)